MIKTTIRIVTVIAALSLVEGGGRIAIKSRHVDINGEISVDGNPPDSRTGQGAGVYTGRKGGYIR